jgi:hypothetical protein
MADANIAGIPMVGMVRAGTGAGTVGDGDTAGAGLPDGTAGIGEAQVRAIMIDGMIVAIAAGKQVRHREQKKAGVIAHADKTRVRNLSQPSCRTARRTAAGLLVTRSAAEVTTESSFSANGVLAAPRRLDRRHVDLLHVHHRVERALRFSATCRQRLGQHPWRDLP